MLRPLLHRLTSCSLALAVLLVAVNSAQACPTCKAALSSGGDNLVNAYMWSILFMMAMPFVLIALIGGYLYLQVRKARTLALAAAAAVQPASKAPADELIEV